MVTSNFYQTNVANVADFHSTKTTVRIINGVVVKQLMEAQYPTGLLRGWTRNMICASASLLYQQCHMQLLIPDICAAYTWVTLHI